MALLWPCHFRQTVQPHFENFWCQWGIFSWQAMREDCKNIFQEVGNMASQCQPWTTFGFHWHTTDRVASPRKTKFWSTSLAVSFLLCTWLRFSLNRCRMETMLVDGRTVAAVKKHYDQNRKLIEARVSWVSWYFHLHICIYIYKTLGLWKTYISICKYIYMYVYIYKYLNW